jgi:signal transduction histidine kinase
LLAVALAVPSLVQVLVWPIFDPPVVGVAVAVAATLPVALRRTRPALAAFLGMLPWLVPTDGHVVLGYVAAFVLFYSLAAFGRRVVLATVFGAGVAALNAPVAAAVVVLGALAGRLVRHERAQTRRLQELTAQLEHERELNAKLAVVEERARIAHELHDVVAHSLSTIAVRAEAALEQDAERWPLRAIRRSAEDALAEMRRLLGTEDEDAAPQPGLAELPALIDRARAAGLPVTLLVDGRPRSLPATLDHSAYRIIEEALSNAHKHAADSPTSVRVVWRRNLLGLQVRDTGTGRPIHSNGDGHGLVRMRERVKLHGGELRAGALPGGGFEVTARLPL